MGEMQPSLDGFEAAPDECKATHSLDFTISAEKMADLLGVSARTIQTLATSKFVHRNSHGQYHVGRTMKALYEASKTNSRISVSKDAPDYQEAKARREQALASLAEMEVAEKRGDLIPADEAASAWSMVLGTLRSTLVNGLPQRIVSALIGVTNEGQQKQIIRSQIVEAMKQANAEVLNNRDE